ncbi:hypothetical protein HK101_007926 [Irineochytrium annulatum]|nr:hypothetical protein HK101_007926 [Irineochytrium annulatum]
MADVNELVERGTYTSLRAYIDEYGNLAEGLPEAAKMDVGTKVTKFYSGLKKEDRAVLGFYLMDDEGHLRLDWDIVTSAVRREVKSAKGVRLVPVVEPVAVTVAPSCGTSTAAAPAAPAPATAVPRRFPTPTDSDLDDVIHRLRALKQAAVGRPQTTMPLQPWVAPAAPATGPTIMAVPAQPSYQPQAPHSAGPGGRPKHCAWCWDERHFKNNCPVLQADITSGCPIVVVDGRIKWKGGDGRPGAEVPMRVGGMRQVCISAGQSGVGTAAIAQQNLIEVERGEKPRAAAVGLLDAFLFGGAEGRIPAVGRDRERAGTLHPAAGHRHQNLRCKARALDHPTRQGNQDLRHWTSTLGCAHERLEHAKQSDGTHSLGHAATPERRTNAELVQAAAVNVGEGLGLPKMTVRDDNVRGMGPGERWWRGNGPITLWPSDIEKHEVEAALANLVAEDCFAIEDEVRSGLRRKGRTVKPARALRELPGQQPDKQQQPSEPWKAKRTGAPVGKRGGNGVDRDTPMTDSPGARAAGPGNVRADPVGGSSSRDPAEVGTKGKGRGKEKAFAERAVEVQKLVDYLLDQRVEKVPTDAATAQLGEILNEDDLEEAWGAVFAQMEGVLAESEEVEEAAEGSLQVDTFTHIEAVDDVPTDQALAIAGLAPVSELQLGAAALEILLRGVCLDSGSQIVTIAKSTFNKVQDGCAVKELALTMRGAGGNHRRLQGRATGLRVKVFDLEWRVQAWILDDSWKPAPYELLLGQPFLLAARTDLARRTDGRRVVQARPGPEEPQVCRHARRPSGQQSHHDRTPTVAATAELQEER